MADRYFNITVEESSEKCKTILTTHGKMRSRGISQEECNTPSTMIEAMLDIVKDVVYQCLVIYIDDIIICSRTYNQHVGDLKKVFLGMEEQKFYLK